MKDYAWLTKNSRTFLSRDYLEEGVTPEQRIRAISENAEKILTRMWKKQDDRRLTGDMRENPFVGFADKFEGYMKKGFYSLSTPVWVSFGNKRGYPVSCFGSYVDDTMESILDKAAEVGTMSKRGGGTSAYFGDLRPRGASISVGGKSSGPVHFLEIFDTVSNVVSQGSARRGSFAAYMPIEHPDILEFLKIRSEGHRIQDIHLGVTITDEWMKSMADDGDAKKRKIWAELVKKRFEDGYPYLFFTDTINNNAPQVYKDKGKKIHASNLCSEICLSSDNEESFTCVLSSLNLLCWDEIYDTDAIETLIYFLDAVNEEFVDKADDSKHMASARKFAKNQRALGMGALGWHYLLQSKMIAFDSMEAKFMNSSIWKTIKERSDKASQNMAKYFGEPELMKGTGFRNATRLAVAPTKSSSFILQSSPSIEPIDNNYGVDDLAKGKFTYKNPYLKDLLKQKDKDTPEIWESILLHGGSVQHLDCLTEHEKNVFKTYGEISQKEIVIQAAQRQKYIDQSQSLNIMVEKNPKLKAKEVSELLIEGWRLGIKTFYYQKGANPSQQLARSILTCSVCEG